MDGNIARCQGVALALKTGDLGAGRLALGHAKRSSLILGKDFEPSQLSSGGNTYQELVRIAH